MGLRQYPERDNGCHPQGDKEQVMKTQENKPQVSLKISLSNFLINYRGKWWIIRKTPEDITTEW